ncbi:MAG: hypothetical protein ACRD1D_15335, partial [Acidimicrobiales bacterium]
AVAWSAGGVAPEVGARAGMEAANVADELRAQATWRERLAQALDPRPLVRRGAPPLRPVDGDGADRVPVGAGATPRA